MNFNIICKSFKLITIDKKVEEFFLKRLNISPLETNNFIEIDANKVKMFYENKLLEIDGEFDYSDLYQIYNNYLSMIINDDNNCYMHSVVISKNNEGILLLGTFGQGKTEFSENSVKYGYEINSSDHTVLSIFNDKLYMIEGSSYVKYKDKYYNLSNDAIHKKIEIKKIILLYGLAANGDLCVTDVSKRNYVKCLYTYCAWHFNLPIKTNIDRLLYNSNKNIITYLNKLNNLNIPTFIVRGDNNKIIDYLCKN